MVGSEGIVAERWNTGGLGYGMVSERWNLGGDGESCALSSDVDSIVGRGGACWGAGRVLLLPLSLRGPNSMIISGLSPESTSSTDSSSFVAFLLLVQEWWAHSSSSSSSGS